MNGKICIVTGANSGIGRATSLALANLGATVVMLCRDQGRAKEVQEFIKRASHNDNVDMMVADLSSQKSIRDFSRSFSSRYSKLHILINNAGTYHAKRSTSIDGLETTFAVNYLAPFLLTNLLLDKLEASQPSRIVNVAGDYHRKAKIDFENLMLERNYSGTKANNQSKLALILFTYELARRLKNSSITVNCLHPGAVKTNIITDDPGLSPFSRVLYKLFSVFFISSEKGANTSVYLASSPEVEGLTGKYFINSRAVKSSKESYDESMAKKLWQVSSKLSKLSSSHL